MATCSDIPCGLSGYMRCFGTVQDSVANFFDEIKLRESDGIVEMWISLWLRAHIYAYENAAT
jgi:hypothetical protein